MTSYKQKLFRLKSALIKCIHSLRASCGLAFSGLRSVHHHSTKRIHNHLLNRLNWYRKWWEWKFHKHVHVAASSLAIVGIILAFTLQTHGAFALSYWTQTDWSGGVGSSSVNQYSSGTNVNTATSNQVTLSTTAGWASGMTSFLYRVPITLTNSGAAATNLQVKIPITYLTGMNANFNDIRFTNSSGTSLNYWIYSETASTSAVVWVEVDSLAATSNTTIYMYYGNSGASSASSCSNTFVFCDQFSGSTISSTNWTIAANTSGNTFTASNGLDLNSTTCGWGVPGMYSNQNFTRNATQGVVLDFDYEPTGSASSCLGAGTQGALMFGWKDNTTGAQYTNLVHGYYDEWANGQALVYELGAGTNPGNPLPYNVNYQVEVAALPGTGAQYQVSSNNFASDIYNLSTNTYGYPTYSSLKIGFINYNKNAVINNVRVRQYFATPPTPSIGSAQTYYATTGTLVSNIFNGTLMENWSTLTYSDTVPSGTTVSVYIRSGNQSNLSDASAWVSCGSISSGGSANTGNCTSNGTQYAQYELVFSSNGLATPTFTSMSTAYSATDTTPPATNASNITANDGNGGASVSANGWINTDPYFAWTAATDHSGGSGIAGYCLYLGTSSSGNPATSSGDLGGSSPLNTSGACPFAVSAADIDTSISGYITSALTSSTSPYYLNVDAITGAGYIWTGSAAQFEFYFDNTPPTNPAFVSAPSEFVSSDNVTLTWPTSGSDSASDSISGVAGLQYRIGSSGTWYGASHTGAQNCTDLLANNGTYAMNSTYDYPNLVQGNNIIYFRTYNNACVPSTANVTTVIKLNSTAPSSPQNLTATPTTNTSNSFAFSWIAPVTYDGSASNITYCYTVNALPTANNCTFTPAGSTSLSTGAYATEPGDNTLYLVAKDEAGNINYATASSVTFTANTPAPGVPLDLEIADVSVKSSSSWKLALSWNAPTNVGAGIATYKLYRSTDGVNFADIASTAGASYVDTGLSQQTYYYKVDACDSANNCGVYTSVVSLLPTGKFTSPANLISGPNATATTRTATVTWVTDRDSDSSIEYGLSSNNYFPNSVSNSNQLTSHTVTLDNLQAGTTYYYRAQWNDVDGNTGTSSEYTFTTLPAPTVSNVNVTGINLTSANVEFTSTGASSVELVYGAGTSNTKTLNTSVNTSTYSIPLTGLNSGTTYSFTLNPTDTDGNLYTGLVDFSFTTPPQPVISNVQFSPVAGALTGTEQVTWTTNVPASSQISYGLPSGSPENQLDTTLTTTHQMTISNLNYDTQYQLTATSVDALGNSATSDNQVFKSGTDTRPPRFSNLTIQPSIVGTGASASGQLIVSWKTDKAGTSQVAYGEGTGTGYTAKTAQNSALVTNHVVVVSGLSTSEVYHVQAISSDADGIQGLSNPQTTIVGQATDNALSIVFNALQSIFGL